MARIKVSDGSEFEKDKIEGGKADDVASSEFDVDELAKGIEIEKEHTDDEKLAEEIAKDHLTEIPDYYTRLRKMEDEAKAELADEGEDIPECTEDVLLLLTFAARQKCTAAVTDGLSNVEGQQIAEQLGLRYDGIYDFEGIRPNAYQLTDSTTGWTILANTLDEAVEKVQRKRAEQQEGPRTFTFNEKRIVKGVIPAALSDAEGRQIAEQLDVQLDVQYGGIQEQMPPDIPAYLFTDLNTKSTFLASNYDEAVEGVARVRERFQNITPPTASKLNLKKTAITWPWDKSDVPEEQPDEVVEPTVRIAPPVFNKQRSPGITEEPVEATPEQSELIQGLAASNVLIQQLKSEVIQIQDEINTKIKPIQEQIGAEGQNQLRATKQLAAMMTELEQALVQAGDQVGYYTEQAVVGKLTPTDKVKILLERFGPKAEQAIAEAQKNLDEIGQIVVGKYRQWPSKTSAIEEVDEQYLASLYQNAFNTIAGLLTDVQELNIALVV